MKQITNLNGTITDGPWNETRGVVQTILDNPQPQFYRHVTLGQAGIVVSKGPGVMVAIPLAEIIKLACSFEPGLIPPATAVPKPGAPVATPAPATAPAAKT